MDYRKPSLARHGNRRRSQRVPSGRQRHEVAWVVVTPDGQGGGITSDYTLSPADVRKILAGPHAVTRLPREQEQRAHEALAAVDTGRLLLTPGEVTQVESALDGPAEAAPGLAATLKRGEALLDEHAPGWQEKVTVPAEPGDPRAALLADVRDYARSHRDDARYAWDRVASMPDAELEQAIGSRVKTVDGALRKLRPVIDALATTTE